jgi:hypothetical protein
MRKAESSGESGGFPGGQSEKGVIYSQITKENAQPTHNLPFYSATLPLPYTFTDWPASRNCGEPRSYDDSNCPSRPTVELRWWLPALFRVSRSLNNEQEIIKGLYTPCTSYLFRSCLVRVVRSTTTSLPGDDRLCREGPIDLRIHPPPSLQGPA